jgi:hypothetical protein
MASPFICPACRTPLEVDENNPPADVEIVVCYGCGRDLGTYGALKAGGRLKSVPDSSTLTSDLPYWLAEDSRKVGCAKARAHGATRIAVSAKTLLQ